MEKRKSNERKTLKNMIGRARTLDQLNVLDAAKIEEHDLTAQFNRRKAAIEESEARFERDTRTRTARVEKGAGDTTKAKKRADTALTEVREIKTEAVKKMGKVVEKEKKGKKTIEVKERGNFGEELPGKLSEVHRDYLEKDKAELLASGTLKEEAEVSKHEPVTKTEDEPVISVIEPAEVDPVTAPKPEVVESTEKAAALETARKEYFEAHGAFMEKRGAGILNKIKNKIKDTIKFEDVKDKTIRENLENKQAVYNEALLARGKEMLANEAARLAAEGKTPEEIEAALTKYKAETVFTELVIKEKSLLIEKDKEQLPSELRAKLGIILTWYSGLNKYQKFALSIAVGTAAAGLFASISAILATGSGGAAIAAGTAALTKAVGLKALAVKAGTTVVGQTVAAPLGGAAVWLKNRIVGFDKNITKATEDYATKHVETAGKPLTLDALRTLQHQYDVRLKKEAANKAWKIRTDVLVRMLTTWSIGMLASSYMNSFLEHHLTGTEPTPPPHDDSLRPHHDPTQPQYEFKKLEVEYSSKGAIDTWAHVKSQLTEAYKGVDPSKIPPEYDHIMHSNPAALAKEFGDWRPDAIDGKESLNMLKGSTIQFNENGEIISHSLRNAHGAATDDIISRIKSDGTAEIIKQGDERFFHYGGQHAHEAPADTNTETKPDFVQDETNTGVRPEFETGIGEVRPEFHGGGESAGDSIPATTNLEVDDKYYDPNLDPANQQNIYDQDYYRYHNYDVSQALDNAQRTMAHNTGGYTNDYPIMNPSHPGGAPIEYQHQYIYGTSLAQQTVDKIMNNRMRFIDEDYLLNHNTDPALPLYKVIHELQDMGYRFHADESVAEYLGRVKAQNQAYFSGMEDDRIQWLIKNGFWDRMNNYRG
jgi:hypothetical protein